MQIIKEDFSEVFFNLAADSKYSIKLCSPNVSEKAMQNLYQVSSNAVPKELITNMNIKHFYDKSSEIEAIDTMMEHYHDVYNNQTLHANLYIFDNQKAIVTSANFNLKGLYSVELNYGLLVTDTALVDEILADFVGIKRNTEKTSLLERSHINKTKKLLEKLYSSRNSMDKFPVIDERKIKELLPLLSSWQKNVTQCILSIHSNEFTLKEVYMYKDFLQKEYPKNGTIEASIRRTLQELRDLGLISFEGNGRYIKLWN